MGSAKQDWKDISAKAVEKLENAIPAEWRIPKDKLPAEDVLDVTDFPAKSGLLTQDDIEITESFATEIVAKLAKGEWSAENVTRAFCKRAAIAHQLVRFISPATFWNILTNVRIDELSHGHHVRRRHEACQRTGRPLPEDW